MIYLEFVGIDGEDVIYDYMPEYNGAPSGRVSVDRITRERKLISKSSEDELSWYRGAAWRAIDHLIDSGDLKDELCYGWY